ncbi:transmembrane amino acid transporter protein-domain-containing protein [Paraphysoderma sedebokerense]|nr:transmembrane amino acid transporter protein-domain-containing protein [Paraphysoderma sedebokerense]
MSVKIQHPPSIPSPNSSSPSSPRLPRSCSNSSKSPTYHRSRNTVLEGTPQTSYHSCVIPTKLQSDVKTIPIEMEKENVESVGERGGWDVVVEVGVTGLREKEGGKGNLEGEMSGGEDVMAEENEGQPKATFLQCFFNLANVAIGVGTLSLPYVFSQVGWVSGIVIIFFVAYCSGISLFLLTELGMKTGEKSYTAIASHTLPNRSYIVTYTFFLLILGALSAYFTVIGDYILHLLSLIPSHPSQSSSRFYEALTSRPIVLLLIAVFVIFPLSSARNMSKLAITSSLSLFAILYIVVLIPWSYLNDLGDEIGGTGLGSGLVGGLERESENGAEELRGPVGEGVVKVKWGWEILMALSTVGMAYVNHSNIIEITSELHRRQPSASPFSSPSSSASPSSLSSPPHFFSSRARLINLLLIIVTTTFISIVYLIVSLAGYFHYGSLVSPNILNSESPNHPAFIIARVGLVVVMVFSFPLLVLPGRACAGKMFDNWNLKAKFWHSESTGVHDEGDVLVDSTSQSQLRSQLQPESPLIDGNQETEKIAEPASESTPLLLPSSRSRTQTASTNSSSSSSKSSRSVKESRTRHYMLTILVITLSYLSSIYITSLDKILSLFGSIAGSCVVYVFPALFYLAYSPPASMEGEEGYHKPRFLVYSAYLNVVVGLIMFGIGSVVAVSELVGRG